MALRLSRVAALVLLAILVPIETVAATPVAHAAPGDTLYTRLGGSVKVTAFVDEAIEKVAADPRLGQTTEALDLQHAKNRLAAQICSMTGGGCSYTADGHAELPLIVEALRTAMRAHEVPLPARNELIELLAAQPAAVASR